MRILVPNQLATPIQDIEESWYMQRPRFKEYIQEPTQIRLGFWSIPEVHSSSHSSPLLSRFMLAQGDGNNTDPYHVGYNTKETNARYPEKFPPIRIFTKRGL